MSIDGICIIRGKSYEGIAGNEPGGEKKQISKEQVQTELSSLLRLENVSFLLGAGCSIPVGGMTFGEVYQDYWQETIEKVPEEKSDEATDLLKELLEGYLGSKGITTINLDDFPNVDINFSKTDDGKPGGNLEEFISNIYHLYEGLNSHNISKPQLFVAATPLEPNETETSLLKILLEALNKTLVKKLNLVPHVESSKDGDKVNVGAKAYRAFVKKLASRPHTLSRLKIFTLNYDLLVEWAADAEGVALTDGFRGSRKRIFRPEVYDQDLFYPAGMEFAVPRRLEQVLHLYKLHGSISWRKEESSQQNPFGIWDEFGDPANNDGNGDAVIYPTPAKYSASHGLPYAEMFRRFADATIRPQSVLFVIGYSLGDEHVNAIINQALAYPSFTLVLIGPDAENFKLCKEITSEAYDPGIWCFSGENGYFGNFVDLLPDLFEEEQLSKVMEYRAKRAKLHRDINNENDPPAPPTGLDTLDDVDGEGSNEK